MELPVLDSEHVYRLDGRVIPGVTTVMQPIVDYSDIDPSVLAYKARLGTLVHYATELHDANTLDYDSLDDVLKFYVDAWILFLNDTGFIVELSEHVVYHERYGYAGTLDRVGMLNGNRVLIDIKCTSVLSAHVGVQLAAYLNAENVNRKIKAQVKKTFALQLKKNGRYDLKLYKEKEDFKVFTSLLNIHYWTKKHVL